MLVSIEINPFLESVCNWRNCCNSTFSRGVRGRKCDLTLWKRLVITMEEIAAFDHGSHYNMRKSRVLPPRLSDELTDTGMICQISPTTCSVSKLCVCQRVANTHDQIISWKLLRSDTDTRVTSTERIISSLLQNCTARELRDKSTTLLLLTFPVNTSVPEIVKEIETAITKTDKKMISSPATSSPEPQENRNPSSTKCY